MAQQWQGKSYDQDWYEVDGTGRRVSDQKDWAASAANTPAPFASTAPAPAAAPAAPANTARNSAVNDRLLAELQVTPEVNQQDPAYRQSVETNRFNLDRAADRQRAATAQRMHAQGTLTGGGLDTAVQRINADQGAQEQAFEADLLRQFRQQNVDRMQRALQLGAGLMSQEQEQALRAQLAREGYALQRELAEDDLRYRYDALGQQLGLSEAQLNQQAMLSLLGA